MLLQPLHLVPVEPRRVGAGLYAGFRDDPRFNPSWWSGLVVGSRHSLWYSGLVDHDDELVRLQLDTKTAISADYEIGREHRDMVEIVRIEVLESHWCQGYGRSAIREVTALHPYKTHGAFSLNPRSDLFWGGIGWSRYEPVDGTRRSPLYLTD